MTHIKKSLSIVLALLMLISVFTIAPITASAKVSGDYKYTILEDDTAEITGYSGSDTVLEIPSELDGYTVTSIGNYAFEECYILTSVTIPDSVTSICSGAFSCCYGLTSVSIPSSVTSIGYCVFEFCSSLTNTNVDSNNTNYCSIEGNLYNKDQTTLIQYAIGKTYTSFTIPSSVTSIGDGAFADCTSLTSVTIPSSVTDIGRYAFNNCTSLTSITIPSSVTSIGDYAFYNCTSLTNITIPSSVTDIGRYAFEGCTRLKNITIENGVTSIGDYAFYNCTSLTSVTIPSSVTYIARYAFGYYYYHDVTDTKLYGFKIIGELDSEAERYANDNGFDFVDLSEMQNTESTEAPTLPTEGTFHVVAGDPALCNGVYWDPESALNLMILGDDGVYSITYENVHAGTYYFKVTTDGAWDNADFNLVGYCNFGGPNAVIEVEEDCSEVTITLKESDMHANAYINGELVDVGATEPTETEPVETQATEPTTEATEAPTLPAEGTFHVVVGAPELCNGVSWDPASPLNLMTLDEDGIYRITYENVPVGTYDFKVTTNGAWDIADFNLVGDCNFGGPNAEITVTEDNSTVVVSFKESDMHANAYINGVLVDMGATEPPTQPFANFKYRILEDGTAEITGYIGYDTVLEIPNEINGYTVTSIGDSAFFSRRTLTSITIPNSVTSIGDSAFSWCDSLTSITIPSSVTSIGNSAFSWCDSLTSITIPVSVTSIGNEAFEYCTSLSSIAITDSVTSIGYAAFYNTAWYDNQPDGVVYAGKLAYKYKGDCPETVTLKDDTIGICAYAFSGCDSLTSITIPSSVASIGESAFEDCTSLTSVTIPSSVTSIGDYAFEDCTSLTSVTIENGVTNIGEVAFSGCTSLTSITIPSSVTCIEGGAFESCTSLTRATIENGVTSIEGWAFSFCRSLTSIEIPDSVTSIGDGAFSGTAWYDNQPDGVVYAGKHAYRYKGECPETVTLKDDTIGICANAFSRCENLTNITIPNSVTSIGYNAVGYYYDEDYDEYKVIDGFKITGYSDTEAERYAKDNGFEFISLGEAPTETTEPTEVTTEATEATETEPTESTTEETKPIQPTETVPVETEPTESVIPTETVPQPTETVPQPTETEPVETQPTQPTETVPVETEPTESVIPTETDPQPTETVPVETQPTQPTETEPTECAHANTQTVDEKTATYFTKGYTGNKVCADCGEVISKGSAVAKKVLKTPKVTVKPAKKAIKVTYSKVKDAKGFTVTYKLGKKTYTKKFTLSKKELKKAKVTKTIKVKKSGKYKVTVKAFTTSGNKIAYSKPTKAVKVKVK